MWIISQGHPFRDSCGVREDQLPVLRVRTGVSDGVLFVMCMSDGPAMIGGASQLPSKDLEPALHGIRKARRVPNHYREERAPQPFDIEELSWQSM